MSAHAILLTSIFVAIVLAGLLGFCVRGVLIEWDRRERERGK